MDHIFGKEKRLYFMGLSMILIVLLHLSELFLYLSDSCTLNSMIVSVFGKGSIGVDIFFFLSSYGLSCSFCHNTVAEFYKRRALRIFPLFLIVSSLFLSAYHYSDGWQKIFTEILFHNTGLAIFRNEHFMWYIPATIILYLIFPILYHIIRYIIQKRIIVVLFVVLINGFLVDFFYIWMSRLFACRLSIIIIGITTYFLLKDKRTESLLKLYTTLAVFGLLFFRGVLSFQLSLSLPLILYAVNSLNVRLPLFGIISNIGKHTLEIYLSQFIVIEWLMKDCIISHKLCYALLLFPLLPVLTLLCNKIQHFSLRFLRMLTCKSI